MSISSISLRNTIVLVLVVFHCVILQPILSNSHPHLLVVYPVLTNEEMTTESHRYNCFTRNGVNAIPKHAGPEDKGSNPTAGLTLLWARNHSGETLTTGTSHRKNPDRFSS